MRPGPPRLRLAGRLLTALLAGAGLVAALFLGFVAFVFRPYSVGSPPGIPQGWGASWVPRFEGRPAVPRPLSGALPPRHPFMAANGSNNMHVDAYVSDVHAAPGPLGREPVVVSRAGGRLGGECASVTFDRRGRIETVCMSFHRAQLLLLDPHTLRELASYELPPRPSSRGLRALHLRAIMTDTSGGAYFYLDQRDRAVLATADQRIRVVSQREEAGRTRFILDRSYALAPALAAVGHREDPVTAVLPDWEGRYWFVTRRGLVGVVDRKSGRVELLELPGEGIQNSFAVAPDGVYIVSDHALYRFRADPATGRPRIVWREAYDRGTRRKVGQLDQGSGTTPTLMGDRWVAITDNAEPRVHVLVYRRVGASSGHRLVCSVPVFAPGRSATDNTLIGFGRSIVVENNYGYDLFPTMLFGRTGAGGVVRIDIEPDGRGCRVVWESKEIAQTVVPKLSVATGLVYLYTKRPHAPWWTDAYYLTAVDFRTGETRFRILTGTGPGYDNNWAPITLGPDGTAYVGTLRGLVAVRDRAAAAD